MRVGKHTDLHRPTDAPTRATQRYGWMPAHRKNVPRQLPLHSTDKYAQTHFGLGAI